MKREFKETFPDTPQGRLDKAKAGLETFDFNVDEADESLKHSKANMSPPPEKDDDMKNRMLAGMKSFFKNEVKDNEAKFKVEKTKKLPKNFANQVLDHEL